MIPFFHQDPRTSHDQCFYYLPVSQLSEDQNHEGEFADSEAPGLTNLKYNNTWRKPPPHLISHILSCFELLSCTWISENNRHRGRHPLTHVKTIPYGIVFLSGQLLHCLLTDCLDFLLQEMFVFLCSDLLFGRICTHMQHMQLILSRNKTEKAALQLYLYL